MDAYDKIGLEYYYLEDLEKDAYYHDRMTRAKSESKLSITRSHFMDITEKKHHNSAIYNKVILKGLKELTITKYGYLNTSENFFNLIQQKQAKYSGIANNIKKYFQLHSNRLLETKVEKELSLSDLPSPRGQSIPSTIMILPYFSEEDNIKNKMYKMECKVLNMRAFRPVLNYIQQLEKVFFIRKIVRLLNHSEIGN